MVERLKLGIFEYNQDIELFKLLACIELRKSYKEVTYDEWSYTKRKYEDATHRLGFSSSAIAEMLNLKSVSIKGEGNEIFVDLVA